jgi:hypothetical protein
MGASMGEDEFGSDWGQFSQPLPLWQDAGVFGGSGGGGGEREPYGERQPRAPAQTQHHGGHRVERRAAPQRSLDTTRYNPRSLPVLDDADEEAMMDDIVGVVVDAPRYATQRPRRG